MKQSLFPLLAFLLLCFMVFSSRSQSISKRDFANNLLQRRMGETKVQNPIDESLLKPIPGESITPLCYVVEGRNSCAPHFIVAGAMKCGTTSLYSYLQNHPSVLSIPENATIDNVPILALKEIRYFLDPTYSKLYKKSGQVDSLNQYLDLFTQIPIPQPNDDILITGEASPMYICQPHVAQRIKHSLPKVKMIIMLRNPVDRAYSEFWFRQFLNKQTPVNGGTQEEWFKTAKDSFEICANREIAQFEHCNATELISQQDGQEKLDTCFIELANSTKLVCTTDPESVFCVQSATRKFCGPSNLRNGVYVLQILKYLSLFDRDQLLFIKSEDFYESTAEQMNRVTKFLGLDPFDWENVASYAYNIVSAGTASSVNHEITTTNLKGLLVGKTANENTSHYPPLDPEVRTKLNEFFRPYNEALEELIGFTWE